MAFAWKTSHGHVATIMGVKHWMISNWTDKNKHVHTGLHLSAVVCSSLDSSDSNDIMDSM